jgi:prepilin-type N-terminal cleavage/methylation domain-containing protein
MILPGFRPDSLPSRNRPAAGFTLIELLLVLTLMGFLAVLVLPRLDQLYLRFLFWLDQDRIEREIAGLGGRAYLEGKTLKLATWPPQRPGEPRPGERLPGQETPPEAPGEPVRLDLPEGWRVVVEPAIVYRTDGACSGGRVTIESGEARRVWTLEPPRCRLQ